MNYFTTTEFFYMFISLFLLIMQVYQYKKVDNLKKDISRIWEQISLYNTIVAIKFLETENKLDKLDKNKDKDGK